MKLVVIFLSSLLVWSCDPSRKVTLFVIEKNAAHPYEINGVNKLTGELDLKTLPDVSMDSPGLHNAVCVTRNDYSYLIYLFKKYIWDVIHAR